MFCTKCGKEIQEGMSFCPSCGHVNTKTSEVTTVNSKGELGEWGSNLIKKFSVWSWMSIISVLCGMVTFYKGVDKLTNYSSSDYGSINAYVGGDAYNYIINGTHTTAFFVLTTMFVIAAIGFLIIHFLSLNRVVVSEKEVINDQNFNETQLKS